MKKRSYIIYILSLLLLASLSNAGKRPKFADFEPAYPKKIERLDIKSLRPFQAHTLTLPFALTINDTGVVSAVTSIDSYGKRLCGYINMYLADSRFEPGKFNGKKVTSKLFVLVDIPPDSSAFYFHWPVDERKNLVDPDLFTQTLRENDIHPPILERFPSFFSDIPRDYQEPVLPFLLYEIELDSRGGLIESKLLNNRFAPFASQIQAALRHATFSPLRVQGESLPGKVYVLVTFFPELTYPSREISGNDSSYASSYYVRHSVKLFPVVEGILMKPILKNGLTMSARSWGSFSDNLACQVIFDEFGYATLVDSSQIPQNQLKGVSRYFLKTSFYAPFDKVGKGQQYQGWIYFQPEDSVTIRITPGWEF